MDPNQCSNTSCNKQKAPHFIYCAECLNMVSARIGDSMSSGHPYYYFPTEQASNQKRSRLPIKG